VADRYLYNRLRRVPDTDRRVGRFDVGDHRLTAQAGAGHARAHVELEVPRGVRLLRSPAGDPPDTEAGDLLLAVPEVQARLDPRFGVQVNDLGVIVWVLGDDQVLDVANAAERIVFALDPWLVADARRPWESVLGVGIADLEPRFVEAGGRARAQLRLSDADLTGELRITPVNAERFDVELEVELGEGAASEPLRLGEAAWLFSTDKVECDDKLVDDAFSVRSRGGAALMKAIAPCLRGYLEFGGRGFDLEIDRERLVASARVSRMMVPRWVWTMADVWRLGGLGFERVGEEAPPRRWFGKLPGVEPTHVELEIGGRRRGTWGRAAHELAAEVRASTADEPRVFRGRYDVVGRLGDHDVVCSLRAPGEALFLATCATPWTFKYMHDPAFDEGELAEVAALFQHWRRSEVRFHVSATEGHGDLDGDGPRVHVLRAWLQGVQARDLVEVWRAMESLLRMKDPDASRSSTDVFLDVVRRSQMKLGPDGVELGHRKGRLFWGEPWHTLHETRLTLRASCRAALQDLEAGNSGITGGPEVFTGPAHFGEKLERAYRKLQEAQGRPHPTLHLKRSDGELVCYVRANRATLPAAVDAMADLWSVAGG
jgi:hypothetical protein